MRTGFVGVDPVGYVKLASLVAHKVWDHGWYVI